MERVEGNIHDNRGLESEDEVNVHSRLKTALGMVMVTILAIYGGYESGMWDWVQDKMGIRAVDEGIEVDDEWRDYVDWTDDGTRFVFTAEGWEFSVEGTEEAVGQLCEGPWGVGQIDLQVGDKVAESTRVSHYSSTARVRISTKEYNNWTSDVKKFSERYDNLQEDSLSDEAARALAWKILNETADTRLGSRWLECLSGMEIAGADSLLDFVRRK